MRKKEESARELLSLYPEKADNLSTVKQCQPTHPKTGTKLARHCTGAGSHKCIRHRQPYGPSKHWEDSQGDQLLQHFVTVNGCCGQHKISANSLYVFRRQCLSESGLQRQNVKIQQTHTDHTDQPKESLCNACVLLCFCPSLSAPSSRLRKDGFLYTFNYMTHFQSQKSNPFQGEFDENKAIIGKKHFFNIL